MSSPASAAMGRVAVAIVIAAGVAAAFYWQGVIGVTSPTLRLPTSQIAAGAEFDPSNFPGVFAKGPGVAGAGHKGSWPWFRGVKRDGISDQGDPLLHKFPPSGPPVLWRAECFEGYAGVAIRNGMVYLLDHDDKFGGDVLRCLSLDDGREIWQRSYKIAVRHDHGKTRTIPAVDDKYVVTIGPRCQVMCCDARSGEFVWGIDMVSRFGTKVPEWHTGQCPFIDDGKAIIAPAGDDVLMAAVDCASGKVVWQSPNPNGWEMTHNSILPMTFDGTRMYVYAASGGVAGVSAADGKILWSYPWKVPMANVPMPVDCGDGRLFLTGGYNSGSAMIQLERRNGQITATEKFRLKQSQFGSEQQTPIFYKGFLYGVMTKDGGQVRSQLLCMDMDGRILWSSGKDNVFADKGGGPYILADGMLLVLSDSGVMTLAEATGDAYRELGEYDFFPDMVVPTADGKGTEIKVIGHEAWAPMAICDGRLILRDSTAMICVDLRAGAGQPAK